MVVGGVGEASVGEVNVGVGTGMGVRGVREGSMVSVTTSVGGVGCCALP